MQKLSSSVGAINAVNDNAGKAFSFLLYALCGIIMVEVILRYAFSSPTHWANELSTFVFGALSIAGGGYVLLHGEHVNCDIFYARFPLRRQALVNLFTSVFFFSFCGLLVWKAWGGAWRSLIADEHSWSVWAPPLYPYKFAIFLGALLVLMQGIAKFITDLNTAAKPDKKP